MSTNGKLSSNKANAPTFSSIVRRSAQSAVDSSPFPRLQDRTPKRKRFDDHSETPTQTTKPQAHFKNRKLVSGTGANVNHGLGEVVPNRPFRVSPYAHLKKSIYISRLQTTVTAEKITSYIMNKMPELKENDIMLRILVKKDRPLEELTYISFRVACTDEHYSKFMDSSFWPAHVMIGEFIERERKQATLEDFAANQPSSDESSHPNSLPNTDAPVVSLMDTNV